MFSHGCIIGWVAPALMLLTSDETPLEAGKITLEQLSWIGSMNCVGAIFGTFTFGCFTSFMGCKRAMVFLGIPATVYWLIIMYGDSVNYIIFARFMAGWTGGGIFSITILYVAEIADDKWVAFLETAYSIFTTLSIHNVRRIRGTLGSIAQLCRNTGMLTSYIVSSFLDYNQLPFVFIIIPIVYIVNFVLLPNTPQYLVKKGKMEVSYRNMVSNITCLTIIECCKLLGSWKSFEVLQVLQRKDCGPVGCFIQRTRPFENHIKSETSW